MPGDQSDSLRDSQSGGDDPWAIKQTNPDAPPVVVSSIGVKKVRGQFRSRRDSGAGYSNIGSANIVPADLSFYFVFWMELG